MPALRSGAKRVPARQRLLDSATRLFYAHGMAATGIDAIIADAGVAKMSLYNNFSSKDELMAAYIQARHQEWLGLYRDRLGGAESPHAGVLAVFDAYLDHANLAYENGFRGCGLLNAAAELPAGSAGREAVRVHKEEVEAILIGHLTSMLGAPHAPATPDPEVTALAEHLCFLLEGSMSLAGLEGRDDRLQHARTLAAGLLDAVGSR